MTANAQPAEVAVPPRIRYYDKEAISEHLHCPICQEVFNYPIALQCGHVFCDFCIHQWIRPGQNSCPECRKPVNMAHSHKGMYFSCYFRYMLDLTAHKFLDSVPVYCSFLGCAWTGRMDALQSHTGDCECNPAKLPDWMVSTRKNSEASDEGAGTTSLRMRLFKSGRGDLLGTAATGDCSIFSLAESSPIQGFQSMSDLAKEFVTSSDIISRNTQRDFIDLSDDD